MIVTVNKRVTVEVINLSLSLTVTERQARLLRDFLGGLTRPDCLKKLQKESPGYTEADATALHELTFNMYDPLHDALAEVDEENRA